MAGDDFGFFFPLHLNFFKKLIQGFMDELLFDDIPRGQACVIGCRDCRRRQAEVKEYGGLANGQRAVHIGLHNKKTAMEDIAPPIPDSDGKHIQPCRLRTVHIVEDRPSAQVILHPVKDVLPDRLKQGMPGRNPFQRRVVGKEFSIKDNVPVFAPQLAELRFQLLAYRPESPRYPPDAIDMPALGCFPRMNAGDGSRLNEEVLDDFGNKPSFFRFG